MKPYTPHNYQKDAIKFGIQNGAAGFLLDPGLGKTSIIYSIFKILKKKGFVRSMLVIAPLRPCYGVWPAEATKWTDFNDLKVVVLHGPEKDRLLAEDADVYVINPEGLGWLLGTSKDVLVDGKMIKRTVRGAADMIGRWWEMLVVDESTRFKHSNTQRFKILKPHIGKFKRRYILTGSPAPNGLLDLFGQIYLLDLGHALGRNITQYRRTYFDQGGFGGFDWTIREGGKEAIEERLRPLVLRMDARDLLELPPLIYNDVEVELPEEARKIYLQMEEELRVLLKSDKEATAANAAVVSGKCRQIANGGIYLDGGEEWEHIHEAKVDAVEEIIEELQGKPALVAYEFKHDLERLQKRFPDAPFIGGGVPASRFKDIEKAWNGGCIPILLAQPQSVAHGLNLQGTGAAIIWHSLTWNLEDYEQFIRRVWRQGQTERVVVHHILAKKTIDKTILGTLHAKDRTQKSLLAALKSYLNKKE